MHNHIIDLCFQMNSNISFVCHHIVLVVSTESNESLQHCDVHRMIHKKGARGGARLIVGSSTNPNGFFSSFSILKRSLENNNNNNNKSIYIAPYFHRAHRRITI